jgi:uncharacterized protein (TIGR02246 family)
MFRSAFTALLATLLLTAAPAAAQAPASDDAAIRAVVAAYAAARDQADGTALAALFTADADQLVSSGEWRRGRPAVVQGSLASSRQNEGARTFTIETVRVVAANVALVDSRYDITPPGGQARRMWASWLLVKDGTGWKIAAIRNMLPASAAGAAAVPR